jgi:hypothetical protein
VASQLVRRKSEVRRRHGALRGRPLPDDVDVQEPNPANSERDDDNDGPFEVDTQKLRVKPEEEESRCPSMPNPTSICTRVAPTRVCEA